MTPKLWFDWTKAIDITSKQGDMRAPLPSLPLRRAMKSGKSINFGYVYGYKLDEDGVPQIVPKEPVVARRNFRRAKLRKHHLSGTKRSFAIKIKITEQKVERESINGSFTAEAPAARSI